MRSGDPFGNHCQRPVALALVLEPVLAHEDGVGLSAPLAHQGRAGLQDDAGVKRVRPLSDAPARVSSRRRSARLGLPWARCCRSSARLRMSRSRLTPKGDSVRCNLRQASRSSCVDRSSKPAISASTSLGSGFRARSLRLPLRPGTGDGPPTYWRADASWIAGLICSPARRCGRPGHAPPSPKQAQARASSSGFPRRDLGLAST